MVFISKFRFCFSPMKFEESKYFKLLRNSKIEFSFGNFFFLDKFVISEVHEGVHFSWENIERVISAIADHYGNDFKIAFLSNKINSYSIEPQHWIRFYNQYDFIFASALVPYSELSFQNSSMEKKIAKNPIKICETLDQAIEWILGLKEFN